jgi:transposase
MDPQKDKIEYLYNDRGLGIRQVAQELGMSPTTLRRKMKALGVQSRCPGPERETWWQTEDYLRSKYVDEGLSTIAIADLVQSTARTVTTWLEKFGIDRRGQGSHWKGQILPESARKKMSAAKKGRYLGAENPNWKGGEVSDEVRQRRSYKAKKWRETVLERDNFTCQECGSTEQLHVHHMLSFADHPERRWDINNGITVCVSCHEKIHRRSFPSWVSGRAPTENTPISEVNIVKQRRLEISRADLEKLYLKHGSCRSVADVLGFSEETVRKKLIELRIERHGVGGRQQFKIPKERLEELYRHHSMREIANKLGVAETLVWKRIHAFGIKKGK